MIDACSGDTAGDDTGPASTDTGDSGIAVSGTGVVRTDACGCGGIPAAGVFGITASLLLGRRRRPR